MHANMLFAAASLEAQMVKNLLQCRRPGFGSWVGEILWRREWLPTLIFLPGEADGRGGGRDDQRGGHRRGRAGQLRR